MNLLPHKDRAIPGQPILESTLRTVLRSHLRLSSRSDSVLPKDIPAASEVLFESLGRSGKEATEVLDHLLNDVVPYLNQASTSPNYYGFVIGGATETALIGDVLASIYDQNVHVHLPRETISTNVEVSALNMLLDLFDLPRSEWMIGGAGSGTFTTGATASNVLGLALGREYVLRQAVLKAGKPDVRVNENGIAEVMAAADINRIQILSTLPHSSIAKAASIVGIGRANVSSVASPSDPLAVDLSVLSSQISKPRTASILVISAGEVNTGRFATTVSLMKEIRRICNEYDTWIHVDGAFGLFGRVLASLPVSELDGYRTIVDDTAGFELADSITGDGHKLLNVPYDCGFFFTRHKALVEEVFHNGNAAYLARAPENDEDGIQSPLNIGIENSRRFRALPVYATLLQYGKEGYLDMLCRQIALARRIVGWLWQHASYEVLPREDTIEKAVRKTFMIVLFRAKDEATNAALVKKINATGRMYISGTRWEDQPAARIAISNWRVDVERDGALIEEVLDGVLQ